MSTLTATAQPALAPSWDETIVPTLRKRLESESRVLTKRLSTISITDSISPPSVSPQDVQDRPIPNGDYSYSAPSQPQRPSAIPRPNYTRLPPSQIRFPPPQDLSTRPPPQGTTRQRTRSTPFLFEDADLPNSNGSSHSSSRNYPGRTTPTAIPIPSRIPTVSRKRSASQSSQRFINGPKNSIPASEKSAPSNMTSYSSETLPRSLKIAASSSSLSKQRIIDEQKPFPSESSTKSIDLERVSSDEETPFQHWYRGDVARNGGVGEYRLGKRMEMLDIANYGHPVSRNRRKHAYEEPILHSENVVPQAVPSRKRAESIESRERASIYIDPNDDDGHGRVLDEMPLTDIDGEETDYEREARYPVDPVARLASALKYDYSHTTPELSHERSQASTISSSPPLTQTIPNYSHPHILQSQTLPMSNRQRPRQGQQQQPPSRPRGASVSQKGSSPPSMTTVSSNQARPAAEQQRGRTNMPGHRSKGSISSNGQKRSKSAGDALRSPSGAAQPSEMEDYETLADAIPDTRVPVPKTGNWDDVILPTIARRLGIDYEEENAAADRERQQEEIFEPAPGTFGYDHSKYKPARPDNAEGEQIPMAEFGERHPPPSSQSVHEHDPTPPTVPPDSLRPRRETMPSAPPFSHYTNMPFRPEARERTDVPVVVQSQPPQMEDDKETTCCRCVVM